LRINVKKDCAVFVLTHD